MPLIQVFTSASAPASDQGAALLRDLSKAVAGHFGKPEQWVMTCLVPSLAMTFGGSTAPACFAAVKNIGKMTPDQTRTMSADLSTRLSKALAVPPDRIYIEFTDAIAHMWSHNGDTFA